MPLWGGRESQASITNEHVLAGGSHGDTTNERIDQLAIFRILHPSSDLLLEPIGEGGAKGLTDVQYEHDRRFEGGRKSAQHVDDRTWPTGGCPDRDHARWTCHRQAFRGARKGSAEWRPSERPDSRTKVGDDFDSRDELQRGEESASPIRHRPRPPSVSRGRRRPPRRARHRCGRALRDWSTPRRSGSASGSAP